jgi:hypothetical protein
MNAKSITTKRHLFDTVGLTLLVLGMAACSSKLSSVQPETLSPPPSPIPSPTPLPTAPLVFQPNPFPTPGETITPWEQLIDRASIEGISWLKYDGQVAGAEKGSFWNYSVEYPSEWYLCTPVTLEHICVQSIPQQNNSSPIDFIKFELLWQKQPPSLENALPIENYITVAVAGERSVLMKNDTIPNEARILSLAYQREGRWILLAGYVNLLQEDNSKLERYTSVLLYMMSSFSLHSTQLSLPSELSVEEYPLKNAPNVEPLTFMPMQGTQEEILAKHQQERGNSFPDNSFFVNGQPGISVQLGNEKLVALESFTDSVTSQGTFQKVSVQLSRGGEIIYSIPAGDGSPINALRGLWAYSNHWALEIAQVTQKISSQNEISLDSFGQIVQDGKLLNERNGYDEAFGFQLMNGKPFYFYKRDGQIGISYDNQEVPLGYAQIPHYQCCSGAELNPKSAQSMVAFFAQWDGKWYYVEIGVFNY